MKIYIDVVFILNLLFDGIILVLTSYMTKYELTIRRLISASIVSASMAFFSISSLSAIASTVIFKLMYSIFIIFIAFYPKSLKKWLVSLGAFYIVTFTLGGMILGVHFFIQESVTFTNGSIITVNKGYGDPTTWIFVCVMFPIGAFIYKKNIEYIKVIKMQQESLFDVVIDFKTSSVVCKGLLDTGNHLSDPFTGNPVIVLDVISCQNNLPEAIVEMAFRWNSVANTDYFNGAWELMETRMIPFSSLGNTNGMMITVASKEVHIKNKNMTHSIQNVRVGLSTQRLSGEGKFNCILHPEMLVESREAV